MNSLERILGYRIEPGKIDQPAQTGQESFGSIMEGLTEFVYPSFDAVMEDVRKLEPIATAHGCSLKYYASTLMVTSYGQAHELSKNVHIWVERWVENYGQATLIEIDVDSRELDKQISLSYVDVKKIAIPGFDGLLKVHQPRDLFKHLHFKPSTSQPTEDKYGETLPLTDLPTMLKLAFSKLDLTELRSLIMKRYALVEMTKFGEKIIRDSTDQFSVKYAKRELTPKMFARFSAGDIYQVQYKGEGRDRTDADSRDSTKFVRQIPVGRL